MSAVLKPLCTDRDLAEIFELTDRRIRQLVKEKVLVKVGDNAYDTLSSIRAYLKFKSAESGGSEGYERARERLTTAKAEKAEIETALFKGQVHEGELVRKFWGDMIQNSKTKLLAIPTALAPQLAAEDNPNIVRDTLDTSLRNALTELAAYDPERLIEGALQQHSEDVGASAEDDG